MLFGLPPGSLYSTFHRHRCCEYIDTCLTQSGCSATAASRTIILASFCQRHPQATPRLRKQSLRFAAARMRRTAVICSAYFRVSPPAAPEVPLGTRADRCPSSIGLLLQPVGRAPDGLHPSRGAAPTEKSKVNTLCQAGTTPGGGLLVPSRHSTGSGRVPLDTLADCGECVCIPGRSLAIFS